MATHAEVKEARTAFAGAMLRIVAFLLFLAASAAVFLSMIVHKDFDHAVDFLIGYGILWYLVPAIIRWGKR